MEEYIQKIELFREKLIYMGYWEVLENNWTLILTALMAGVLAFAVLNCFWGYQMMRLWISMIGLGIGALGGAVLGMRLFDDRNVIFGVAVVCGMAVAMLVNLIYRLGLIVLCGGIVFLTCELLFPLASVAVHTGFIALGIAAGVASFEFEDLVVTFVTGICGGLCAARMILMLCHISNAPAAIVLGAVIAAFGIWFQYGKLRKDPDVEARQQKLRKKWEE